jgi:hypothetical protein
VEDRRRLDRHGGAPDLLERDVRIWQGSAGEVGLSPPRDLGGSCGSDDEVRVPSQRGALVVAADARRWDDGPLRSRSVGGLPAVETIEEARANGAVGLRWEVGGAWKGLSGVGAQLVDQGGMGGNPVRADPVDGQRGNSGPVGPTAEPPRGDR